MRVIKKAIEGVLELQLDQHVDKRGSFVKTFHRSTFSEYGLNTEFKESYYSTNSKGVLRGMHFQLPPEDHDKLVYCVEGCVWDVVLDLRRSSLSFGEWFSMELSGDLHNAIYIPSGMAHGFYTVSERATLVYMVSSEYSPGADSGIRWDSCGINWPGGKKIISERDSSFTTLSSFDSPFQ